MTKTEYLEQICTAMGIDVTLFPDRLLTTYLSAIATHLGVDIDTLEGYTLPQWLEAIKNNAGNAGGGGGSAAPTTPTDNRTSLAYWFQYRHGDFMIDVDYDAGEILYKYVEELEHPTGTQNVTNSNGYSNVFVEDYSQGGMLTYHNIDCVKMVGELDLSGVTYCGVVLSDAQHLIDAGTIILPSKNVEVRQLLNYLKSLEEVRLKGKVFHKNGLDVKSCPMLSVNSLVSILNALEDYSADTSGTTWTVTIGSTNMAKLTEEQLDIAYAKGWQVK